MDRPVGILGRKLGMTSLYDENGNFIPATVIEVGPCVVLQVKKEEKEGYNAIQVGFLEKKKSRWKKPEIGHAKKAGVNPMRFVREFRVVKDDVEKIKVGDKITVDTFEKGMRIDIIGISKGRGFAGVVKRHGFGGGRATHGFEWERKGGSIGQCAFPSRVMKGLRMAGHMGNKRCTVRNLEIVDIDKENNLIVVKGSVPGANKGFLKIRPTNKLGK